ncbi:39S ribosomal protein L46, mitochondrial isoform X2 [Notolabrus celidotus]|uniref:39S ribosomal protein L46, mitochondrial isoform X2 n=1 Tax=Notolabrus celidotus TaxID=1203425 RepID=UPI0014901FCC|nr:39S ribosomal protein L46, mitochondrial isoform X2 [Notolabrus celidotus]
MQQNKMAAPCSRMASRSVLQLRTLFIRTALGNMGLRPFSGTSACQATPKTRIVIERARSPWTLMAAVCLQRLPVISADCNPIEKDFREMMQQMEFEKSLLSEHELRLLEDAERLSRKQADDYDSDEEDGHRDQDIVLAQDLEDSWEQRMKKFQPVERIRADVDKDLTSAERCLDDSLLLLAEQEVGGEKMWLLPQTQWQEGETLRQTAERALASLPAAFKATFLGNAPCGVYKYKLPKAARTESTVGRKVFFFKAILSDGGPPAAPNASLLWAKKNELQRYLKPAYMMKVERFIIGV